MLEDLRENVLTLLEERVERAIETINNLREEKVALESENNQLRNDLDQRDVEIHNLEQRNAELTHFESEITMLRAEREQERLEADKEKLEVRERLEGLMTMLNNVENRSESQAEAESSVLGYTSETVDNTEESPEAAPGVLDDTSEAVDDTEEQQEQEQAITLEDTLFIPTRLVEPQEAEQSSNSDDASEKRDKDTDDETEFA